MDRQTTDQNGSPVVAITGIGLMTALGSTVKENWAALIDGKSGLKAIDRFPVEGLRSAVAGTVDAILPDSEGLHCVERARRMGEHVGEQALAQAGLADDQPFPGALFIAASPSEFEWPQFLNLSQAGGDQHKIGYPRMLEAARSSSPRGDAELMLFAGIENHLAQKFQTTGAPISVCTACASGATAIGLGVEAIRRGQKAALCIGTDSTVHQEALVRFSLLSAVSTHNDPPEKASRPFDKTRSGFVVAEGAAALVLENYDHARKRGAEILGVVRGYGEKADTFHRTRSMPDGSAMIGAIENTLKDAGVTPDQIDHVNAHGTSTPENDKMEALSLTKVFGERIKEVPVVSNKGQLGHTLLAAGAVEAVISLLTMKHGVIPATMNYEMPDPAIDLDVVPNTPREQDVKMILSNSFGFGGQNACLVLSNGEEYDW
jgi:3-oxoacyl-[acyl-carrier-protein] synthase II